MQKIMQCMLQTALDQQPVVRQVGVIELQEAQ